MAAVYNEPQLSVLVLDFLKKEETFLCLNSIRNHVKVPHKIIYHHNGEASYPIQFMEMGLIDQLIQTKVNTGLGIGTRNLFAACFSKYALYLQNDQFFFRDLTQEEFTEMTLQLGQFVNKNDSTPSDFIAGTISLAGSPCGPGIYSERAHLVLTVDYQVWERSLPLGYHGAGPYHDGPWREAQIQALYKEYGFVHYEWPTPLVADNGKRAIRQNPDGSVWRHEPDTKRCYLVSGPVKERHVYPRFTNEEWDTVISTQAWPPGMIPEQERSESFIVPQWH